MELISTPRPLWQRYLAVLGYLIASLALVQVGAVLLVAWKGSDSVQQLKNGLPFRFLMQTIIVQMAAFLIPAPLLMKFTRARIFSFRPARLRDIFLCCALTFASLVFFSALYGYLKIEPQQLGFLDGSDILFHKAAFITITSVAVPAYEEWVFRGLIFGILVSEIADRGRIITAAAFCALIFTASHIEGLHSLSALPPILTMALIFQYCTWRSQSLWPAVVAHGMQNLLSSIVFFAKFAADAAK